MDQRRNQKDIMRKMIMEMQHSKTDGNHQKKSKREVYSNECLH